MLPTIKQSTSGVITTMKTHESTATLRFRLAATTRQTYDEKKEDDLPISDRFHRQATEDASLDEPCVLTIEGRLLDVTQWAKAHPGGSQILQQYHGKDATAEFEKVGHSKKARAMLGRFMSQSTTATTPARTTNSSPKRQLQARNKEHDKGGTGGIRKLFSHEDRFNIHKALGIFCLANFAYRLTLMVFGDPTAGFTKWPGLLSLIPHGLLSCSSLIFGSVPRERIVGQPMMWQEFRAHSIVFGMRSILCCVAAAISMRMDHVEPYRTWSVIFTGVVILGALAAASWATVRLEPSSTESTTATMPYWKGCTPRTQRMFKHFYALSQFAATIACLMVSNPAWPLAVLFPIQGAAFLLTLVRKGLLTPYGYHVLYTLQLLSVFVVGIRHLIWMWTPDILILFGLGIVTYQLRRMGVDKFAIWVPIVLIRVVWGDQIINHSIW